MSHKTANQTESQTNSEQKHCFDDDRNRRIAVLYAAICIADVAAWAYIAAFTAGDTLAHMDVVLIGLYRNRTVL